MHPNDPTYLRLLEQIKRAKEEFKRREAAASQRVDPAKVPMPQERK